MRGRQKMWIIVMTTIMVNSITSGSIGPSFETKKACDIARIAITEKIDEQLSRSNFRNEYSQKELDCIYVSTK